MLLTLMHFSFFLLSKADTCRMKSHLINVLLFEKQGQTLPKVFEEI